jgi:hypothetical protein
MACATGTGANGSRLRESSRWKIPAGRSVLESSQSSSSELEPPLDRPKRRSVSSAYAKNQSSASRPRGLYQASTNLDHAKSLSVWRDGSMKVPGTSQPAIMALRPFFEFVAQSPHARGVFGSNEVRGKSTTSYTGRISTSVPPSSGARLSRSTAAWVSRRISAQTVWHR